MILAVMQAVFFVIVACYLVYALLDLRMVLLSQRTERQRLPELAPLPLPAGEALPTVSVLLPVYNEAAVVVRLIDAACALEYPQGCLEILVLDDSDDETTALAEARIAVHAADGVAVRLVRREDKQGHKAGNLLHGVKVARGDFLAIFDADFLPPADFLLRTMPSFSDPELGFLQTGIDYLNRDVSFLTRFQAMEMGHQQFVTVGLNEDGLMASLSGSSCVWRRRCIEDVGNWSTETITEDVDLGYRAQLQRWKYAFLRDVVSFSELPETMSAFRVQRERWARGLVHNAFRHCHGVLTAKMSLKHRLHAVSMMFSSLLLASFFLLLLLSLPGAWLTPGLGVFFHVTCTLFGLALIIWVAASVLASRRRQPGSASPVAGAGWWQMYAYAAMFLPMSLYYFVGAVHVLFGSERVQAAFHRTPKGGGGVTFAMPRINGVLAGLEYVMLVYAFLAMLLSLWQGNYWIFLFTLNACVGFALAIRLSWLERVPGPAGDKVVG